MSAPDRAPNRPRQQLSLLDCTCIIVGIIIGSGIYETTPLIAANTSGAGQLLLVWLLGGLAGLIGALCYAELTTTYPREGGDYVFLTRAYGRPLGLLFAWCEFWIVRPCNIGAMAYVFARYAARLLGRDDHATFVACAVASIVALTVVNLFGVQAGKWTQNLLTAIKVIGLLAVFGVAMLLTPPPQATVAAAPSQAGNLQLAMILVLFTYGGWNDMSYVAAEVRNPQVNLIRGLLLGTAAVTAIYVLINIAFLRGLGFQGIVESEAVAADFVGRYFPRWGGRAISALICVSCLGAISGMMFTGARVYYAMGTEHPWFDWLGRWNGTVGAPIRALVVQSLTVLALVVSFGWYRDSFERLVIFSSPFFWFFFLLVGISLFVLRRRDRATPRQFRVPLYPLTPLVFCGVAVFMLHASANYLVEQQRGGVFKEGLWAALVLLSGTVLVAVERRSLSAPRR